MPIKVNNKPYPISTNIRYDRTNKTLCADIDDLHNVKCTGTVVVYSNGVMIHEDRHRDFRKAPRCLAIEYIPNTEEDLIEVKVTLENKIAKCKTKLNMDNIRDGLSWEQWENGK